MRSCYEAGRDGFWLHRWLVAHGHRQRGGGFVEHRSESSGAAGEDGSAGCRQAAAAVAAVGGGEPRVWSVVHVPTPEAEAARQLTREIATVRADRTRVRNRIQGLLATQGIRCALTRHFPARLGDAADRGWAAAGRRRGGSGWRASGRTSQAIEARLAALRARRATPRSRRGRDRVAQVAQQLCATARRRARRVRRSTARNCSATRTLREWPAARRADRLGAGAVSQ